MEKVFQNNPSRPMYYIIYLRKFQEVSKGINNSFIYCQENENKALQNAGDMLYYRKKRWQDGRQEKEKAARDQLRQLCLLRLR
jgi:hypothetical protein